MGLTSEHVGSKTLAKIKGYVLTRAELLIILCYEILCRTGRLIETLELFHQFLCLKVGIYS